MKSKQRSSRKKLLVDRQLQGLLLRTAAVHWAVFIVAAFIISTMVQFCIDPFEGLHASLGRTARQSAPIMMALVCLSPIFVHDLLKVSNRALGPLVRIKRALGQLANGDTLEPLAKRDGDGHEALIEELNSLILAARVGVRPSELASEKEPTRSDQLS